MRPFRPSILLALFCLTFTALGRPARCEDELDKSKFSLFFEKNEPYRFVFQLTGNYQFCKLAESKSDSTDKGVQTYYAVKIRSMEMEFDLVCVEYDKKGNATLDGTAMVTKCIVRDSEKYPVEYTRANISEADLAKNREFEFLDKCKDMPLKLKITTGGEVVAIEGPTLWFKKILGLIKERDGYTAQELRKAGADLFSDQLFMEVLSQLFSPFHFPMDEPWRIPYAFKNTAFEYPFHKFPLEYNVDDRKPLEGFKTFQGRAVCDEKTQKQVKEYLRGRNNLDVDASFVTDNDKHMMIKHSINTLFTTCESCGGDDHYNYFDYKTGDYLFYLGRLPTKQPDKAGEAGN